VDFEPLLDDNLLYGLRDRDMDTHDDHGRERANGDLHLHVLFNANERSGSRCTSRRKHSDCDDYYDISFKGFRSDGFRAGAVVVSSDPIDSGAHPDSSTHMEVA